MSVTAPIPEELADVFVVRAATGELFKRLIINGNNGLADDRAPFEVGQTHFDFRLFARRDRRFRRENFDVQHAAFRRNDDFARYAVKLAVRDGSGFDEEVRHIALFDFNVDASRSVFEFYNSRFRRREPVFRAFEEKNRRVGAVGRDLNARRFADFKFRFFKR